MKLPPYKTVQRNAHERERLAAWLAERDLDHVLADDDTAATGAPGLRYTRRNDSTTRWREGDIAILRPGLRGSWSPVYVLLMARANDDAWIAVPFSRYRCPAIPGEWATPLSAAPLRVLCFWNQRVVTADRFLGGATKKLTPGQFDRAKRVFAHIMQGAPLDSREEIRQGPPLLHPADPRYEYMDEERARLDAHVVPAASGLVVQPTNKIITYEFGPHGKSEWLMAAEGRGTYKTKND